MKSPRYLNFPKNPNSDVESCQISRASGILYRLRCARTSLGIPIVVLQCRMRRSKRRARSPHPPALSAPAWVGNTPVIAGLTALSGRTAPRTTIAMSRGARPARNRSSQVIQRRGPNRAESSDAAAALPGPADVFDHLDRCSNLLTVKELAALLAVSPKTIYGHVARNLIPHYRIAASVRFRARDIAEWLRSHAA